MAGRTRTGPILTPSREVRVSKPLRYVVAVGALRDVCQGQGDGEPAGYGLAQRLRAQPSTANAVLAAVTGYGRDQDRAASREAGCDFHFVKPLDPADLAALLGEIAASRRRASAAHGAGG